MSCTFEYKNKSFRTRKELADFIKSNQINLPDFAIRINAFLTKDNVIENSKSNKLFNDIGYVESEAFKDDKDSQLLNGIIQKASKKGRIENNEKVKKAIDNFLSTLGVRVEYFTQKGINGVARLAEGIIAMREGYADMQMLEEIAHFALEMWNGSNLKDYDYGTYVRGTIMYQKYAEMYREHYGNEGLSGEALEDKVNLEILGKILAEQMYVELTSENNARPQYSGFFGAIKQFIRDFLDYFMNERSVDDLLATIYSELTSGNAENFQNRNYLYDYYYNLSAAKSLSTDIKSQLNNMYSIMRTEQAESIANNRKKADAILAEELKKGTAVLTIADKILREANHLLTIDNNTSEPILKSVEDIGDSVVQRALEIASGLKQDVQGIAEYLAIWTGEVKMLERLSKSSSPLSIKDFIKGSYATNELREEIRSIESMLNEEDFAQYKDAFELALNELLTEINKLEKPYKNKAKESVLYSIEKEAREVGASESTIANLKREINTVTNDMLTLVKNGLTSGGQGSGLIGYIYQLINKSITNIAKRFNEKYIPLIDKLSGMNLDALKGMHNGKRTHFIINPYNQEYVLEEERKLIAERVKGILTEEEIKQIFDGGLLEDILITEEKREAYYEAVYEVDKITKERPWEDSYYETKEEDFNKALEDLRTKGESISDTEAKAIKRKIRNMGGHLQARKAEIYNKYRDANGRPRIENMSPEDAAELESINIIYKSASTIYDDLGIKKQGIEYLSALTIKQMKENFFNNMSESDVSEEDVVAFVQEAKAQGKGMLAYLKKLGIISYTTEFGEDLDKAYNNIGEYDLDAIQEFIPDIETILGQTGITIASQEDALAVMESLRIFKSDMLSKYRQGQEIIVQKIPLYTLEKAERVHKLMGEINGTKQYTEQEKEIVDSLEADFVETEQYKIDLANGLVTSAYLTDKGKPKFYYRKLAQKRVVETFKKGRPETDVKSTPQEGVYYLNETTGQQYIYNELEKKYVEVAPLNERKGEMYIKSGDAHYLIKVAPSSIWLGAKSNVLKENPRYNANMRGKTVQYKRSFKGADGNIVSTYDKSYFELFGIDESNPWGAPTKNLELWEARQMLLDAKEEHDKNDLFLNNAYFKLPQVFRQKFEFATNAGDFFSNAKSWAQQSFITMQQDAEEFGNTNKKGVSFTQGKVRKAVPKFYTANIDADMQTDNILYAYMMYGQMAINYNEKSKVALEAEKVKNVIRHKQYKQGEDLINGEVSKTYQALQSFVDREIYASNSINYGDINTPFGKISVSKTINAVSASNSISKMGYNIWVAMTGTLSGAVSKLKDRISYKYGTGTDVSFTYSEMEALSKLGEISLSRNRDKILQLMNNMGMVDLRELSEKGSLSEAWNATFGIASPFALMKGLDMPHLLMATVNGLIFYRKINNKWVSYTSFVEDQVMTQGKTLEEANEIWDKNMENSLYHQIDIDENGQLIFKDESAKNLFSRAGSMARRMHSETTMALKDADRADIQRHPIMKFVGLFKNYFFVAANHWFKQKTYDADLGIYTQGSFYTANKDLAGFMQFLVMIKKIEDFQDLTPYERAQLERARMDVYALALFFVLFVLLNNAADDDEDNIPLQLASIFTTRLYDELIGGTPAGLGQTAFETAKSPLALIDPTNKFGTSNWSFDDVKSGPFQGMPKIQKMIISNSPINNIYKLSGLDLNAQRNSELQFRMNFSEDLRKLIESL